MVQKNFLFRDVTLLLWSYHSYSLNLPSTCNKFIRQAFKIFSVIPEILSHKIINSFSLVYFYNSFRTLLKEQIFLRSKVICYGKKKINNTIEKNLKDNCWLIQGKIYKYLYRIKCWKVYIYYRFKKSCRNIPYSMIVIINNKTYVFQKILYDKFC